MYAKKKISIKKILKICGIVVGVIILLVVLFFGFIMLTEFKPEERTTLTVEGNDEEFEGTYTKSGATEHKSKKAGTRKSSPRKVDYDSLNKNTNTYAVYHYILHQNNDFGKAVGLPAVPKRKC